MKKYLTNEKNLFWLLMGVLILSFIPLILVGLYNHPCADDFSYGIHTIGTWRDTSSVFQTIGRGIEGTKDVYNTWQGSFSGVFLMTLHPAVFSEGLYALVTPVLLIAFSASVFYLCHVVFTKYCGASTYKSGIIAAVLIFLSIQFVISPVESFFWYNGSMYYTFFYSLGLILVGLVLSLVKEENPLKKTRRFLWSCILGFFLGGGNFVVALVLFVTMAVTTGCTLLRKKKGVVFPAAVTLFVGLALAISIIAPGNQIRQSAMMGMSAPLAVISSFYYSVVFLFNYIRIPVYFALLALLPLLRKIAKESSMEFPLPGVATAIFYAIYSSSFTANLFGMHSLGPARVANVNQYIAIVTLVGIAFYWSGWAARRPTGRKAGKETSNTFATVMTLTCLFVVGGAIGVMDNINGVTSVSATVSLISGEAKEYSEEYEQRLIELNSEKKQIVLHEFKNKPYVLFFDDITSDKDDWRNVAVANFYDKESVELVWD